MTSTLPDPRLQTPNPACYSALQLRCLIRNDKERIAHLADEVAEYPTSPLIYSPEREALLQRLGEAIRRMNHRGMLLTALMVQPAEAEAAAQPSTLNA